MTSKIESLIEFNSRLDAILFATQDDSANSTLKKIGKSAALVGALGLTGYGIGALEKNKTGIADLAKNVGSKLGSLASSGVSAGSTYAQKAAEGVSNFVKNKAPGMISK
jgi:hypothetical protein